jgi:PBP1b-binding outer membrane lipoprotein LpoB
MINKQFVVMAILSILLWTGCTGVITGHQYTAEDLRTAEEVYLKAKESYIKIKEVVESRPIDTDL